MLLALSVLTLSVLLSSVLASDETSTNATTHAVLTCHSLDEHAETIDCDGNEYFNEKKDVPFSAKFWLDLGVSLFCVLFAGLMSGLTLGLVSIDPLTLRIIVQSTDPADATKRYRASRVLPLLRRKHLLMCTLLIANAGAMETLPIFLDKIVGALTAIIVSVTAVLIFGEIIPQALCSRYSLAIGSFCAPLVWALIILLSPLGWPLAKGIDLMLGENHENLYRRAELKELIGMHAGVTQEDGIGKSAAEKRVAEMRNEIARLQRLGLRQQYQTGGDENDLSDDDDAKANGVPENAAAAAERRAERRRKHAKNKKHDSHASELPITSDEARIIRGVLDMNAKRAVDVMTPMDKLQALEHDTKLDALTLRELRKQGRNYYAVRRQGGGVAGVLLATSLIGITPSDSSTAVSDLILPLSLIPDNMPLYDALNALRRGNNGRMAVVCDHTNSNKSVGILTLDDIVSAMLQADEVEPSLNGVDEVPDVPITLRKGHHPAGLTKAAKRKNKDDSQGGIPLLEQNDENFDVVTR